MANKHVATGIVGLLRSSSGVASNRGLKNNMKRFLIALTTWLAFLGVAGAPNTVQASPLFDQGYGPDTSGIPPGYSGNQANSFIAPYTLENGQEFAQTFTVGVSGLLSSVNVRIFGDPPTIINNFLDVENVTLAIRSTLTGPDLASVAIPGANIPTSYFNLGGVSVDLTTAGVQVHAGESLAIVMSSTSTNGNVYWVTRGVSDPVLLPTTYAGGSFYYHYAGSPWGNFADGYRVAGQDAGFNTFVDPSLAATPLPAALPLFATGLGALGLLGRRRKRKAAALAV